MNEETLFHEALKTPSAQRAAFLADACGGDLALRHRMEILLEAHDNPDSRLNPNSPAFIPTIAQPASVVALNNQIGPYKLLQPIGEGGMGTVYMAEQTEPVQRKVALKLIKPGMDSRQVISRFEAERQALALMDHPHIAKVLDAGTTDAGLPYFVMELVRGTPITKYCDEHQLTPRERLELFIPVCQAVQHAHQKGIIHRDLKPSNVLVALYDGRPVPKVIDFGVAKATGQKLTDRTMYTEFGAIVGTLEYMSPEQAESNQLDIDTRSDIYSLGVLLYELLTGTTPFEKKRLKDAALLEILRIIREDEPQKPSTRLSTTDELPSISANRGLEPKTLSALVRGELDWIVMKALEKDRDRRYETANGFALDIQRYLADEPVAACPPSAAYRFRKFARRNKAAFAIGATVAAALVVAIVTLVVSNVLVRSESHQKELALEEKDRALKQKDEALVEKVEALKQKGQALIEKGEALTAAENAAAAEKAANTQAQKRLAQIEKANDILGSIFENLDPSEIAKEERPLQAILVEKLDRAVAELEGESIGDPLVVAAMQTTLGYSLVSLGEPDKAIVLLEKARTTRQAELRNEHPDTLAGMNILANAYQAAGKWDLALPLFEETLKLRKVRLGPEHPDTLTSMNNLALAYLDLGKLDLALPLFEETLQLRKSHQGDEDPLKLIGMNNLALAYMQAGKLDLALPLFEETLQLRKAKHGVDHPDTLISMSNLGSAYRAAGKPDLALPLIEETLKLRKVRLGPDHPQTLHCMGALASAYRATGKRDLALSLFEETLQLQKAKLGSEHPHTLTGMNNLAGAYLAAGKPDLALPLIEETLKLRKVRLGPAHPETITSMNNLASAYRAAGKLDLALPLYEETVQLWKVKLGPEHPNTLTCMNNLALAYQAAGKMDLALPLFEETLKLSNAKLGPDHPDTLTRMNNLADIYERLGSHEEVIGKFSDLLKLLPDNLDVWYRRGLLQLKAGKRDEAVGDFSKAGELRPGSAPLQFSIGTLLAQFGVWDEAAIHTGKALALEPSSDNLWWMMHASFVLRAGDTKGYRQVCLQMLERFREPKNPIIAHRVALACLLIPDAVGDQPVLMELARLSVSGAPHDGWCAITLGLASYRTGQFEQAAQHLRQVLKTWPENPYDAESMGENGAPLTAWLILAMVCHRLDQSDEARQWLNKAVRKMDQELDEEGMGRLRRESHVWAMCQVLRGEAETLVKKDGRD
jgi:serine/threonine protein kinase/Tfp pilus assembly protein PilF